MKILDGRQVQQVRKAKIVEYVKGAGNKPTLAIVQVGDNPASNSYIKQKKNFGESVGISVVHSKLDGDISFSVIRKTIEDFNKDKNIHGIIVQLPLSEHLDPQEVIDLISPLKDVDGLTTGQDKFVPATARGILTLLKENNIEIKGKSVVVIGRSKLVGAPTAKLMEREGAEVVVCHRGTKNIPEQTKQANIIIVAAGHPNLITKEYVGRGQVVVDVGISSIIGTTKKIVGDVDFEEVSKIVEYISPVPGGVGPMTVLSLFENLIDSHKLCNN